MDCPVANTLSEIKYNNQEVRIKARVHSKRVLKKRTFLILRSQGSTIQALVEEVVEDLPLESVVVAKGRAVAAPFEIRSCTVKNFELVLSSYSLLSKAVVLPIQLEDCCRPPNSTLPTVSLENRLNYRAIDMRTPVMNAVFRLRSFMLNYMRSYLIKENFIEINTPKLLGAASEGGSEVFQVDYFDRKAYLAQSPQLYKQMAIVGDLNRVFEVGPVFRAEKSETHRHLTEFTGFDAEMEIENYRDVVNLFYSLFVSLFDELYCKHRDLVNQIKETFPHEDLKYKKELVILTFKEGVELLRSRGHAVSENEDLNREQEKILGDLVKETRGVDFYVLEKYPHAVRAFYSMPCEDGYCNSYDFMIRGEEILSGAQRIHDKDLLLSVLRQRGIVEESLRDYVDSFSYGSSPHGGVGIGIERVVMLILGLKNVRNACMFPRDTMRLTP